MIIGSGGISGSAFSSKSLIMSCKSHKESERKRRERINGHLATLRRLLPNTSKRDKASLLAEVVQQIRKLSRQVADESSGDQYCLFPDEKDELTLSYCDVNKESSMIRASFSYEDGADLMSDLTQALRSVRGEVVRAEMATVGGRTKSVFTIQQPDGGVGVDDRGVYLVTLRRALKAVLEKPNRNVRASGKAALPPLCIGSNHQL